ncbi:hypothetical protein GH714_036182 [Hevea brasiliensis]|uniref:Uncharacterized protein n=1 Tax=Hevea brasiliensis TaxID=3981 RepID=A0A6A6KMA4_HEVBR|nr:hypothetical protein GH714_036182 [Hevea brasiliensis]
MSFKDSVVNGGGQEMDMEILETNVNICLEAEDVIVNREGVRPLVKFSPKLEDQLKEKLRLAVVAVDREFRLWMVVIRKSRRPMKSNSSEKVKSSTRFQILTEEEEVEGARESNVLQDRNVRIAKESLVGIKVGGVFGGNSVNRLSSKQNNHKGKGKSQKEKENITPSSSKRSSGWNSSPLWRAMKDVWPNVIDGPVWSVGNGYSDKFWKDVWILGQCFLVDVAHSEVSSWMLDDSVADYVAENEEWSWDVLECNLPRQTLMNIVVIPPPSSVYGPDTVF